MAAAAPTEDVMSVANSIDINLLTDERASKNRPAYSLPILKEKASGLGLKTQGNKKELVARIREKLESLGIATQ